MKKRDIVRRTAGFAGDIRPTLFAAVLLSLVSYGAVSADPEVKHDPYQIMEKYFTADGELNSEVELEMWHWAGHMGFSPGGDMFDIEVWEAGARFHRTTSYFGGEYWQISNGKVRWDVKVETALTIDTTVLTAEKVTLSNADSTAEVLNRDSKIFQLSFLGLDSVDTNPTYVVLRTNTLTPDSTIYCIDTNSYMLLRLRDLADGSELVTTFDDFRTTGPFLLPYSMRIHETGQPVSSYVTIQEWSYEAHAPDSLFDISSVLKKVGLEATR